MKYTGKLAKPIVKRPISLLQLEESARAATKAEVDEMFSKLPVLFAFHGIREFDWCGLCLALAKEHVPGFRVVNPAGRKTEWAVIDKAELKIDVDALIEAKPGLPVTEALARVARQERWTEKAKGMKVAALAKHYYAADARWVRLVRDARSYEAITKGE